MSISDKDMGAMMSLTLEIEGLLLLLQRRGDLVHPEVATLLNQKIAELARYAGGVTAQVAETVPPTSSVAPAAPVAPAVDVEVMAPLPETDAEAIARSVEFEETEHADMPRPEAEAPVVEAVTEIEPEIPEVIRTAPVESTPEHMAPKVVADTMPKFTLNDRFRFRNTLFGGDEKEFAETLSVISGMSSPHEVEEYITDDLCLDPADQDVADFLTIVTARFA